MKKALLLIPALLFLVYLVSCNKPNNELSATGKSQKFSNAMTGTMNVLNTSSLIDSMPPSHDDDSIERMTVLGAQVTNPYTVPIMKQAYANLGLSSITVNVTNLYVRFLPTTDQVSALDSTMDDQGLELFDAPMDLPGAAGR